VIENRRGSAELAGCAVPIRQLVGQLGHHQPPPARGSPPGCEPLGRPAVHLSCRARLAGQQFNRPEDGQCRAHPHLVAGGLEPDQGTPRVLQAAVAITAHGVQQGDVELGQQLASAVAEAEAQFPRERQFLTGREVFAAVAVDAAELMQCLCPGQVIPQFGELVDSLGDDGDRRAVVSRQPFRLADGG
jgi:hypothetical protein